MSHLQPNFQLTLATFPPTNINELTFVQISKEWILEELASACKSVCETKQIKRIFIHVNSTLAAIVLIKYDDSNCITISRAEFSNIKSLFPYEFSLALPYPLYALIFKLQKQLDDIVGCPVRVDRLWGWGYNCNVHYQLEKNDFKPMTNIIFDKDAFPHLEWSDDPVKNAGNTIYLWKETLPFIYAIQDVCNNFNKNITLSIEYS